MNYWYRMGSLDYPIYTRSFDNEVYEQYTQGLSDSWRLIRPTKDPCVQIPNTLVLLSIGDV